MASSAGGTSGLRELGAGTGCERTRLRIDQRDLSAWNSLAPTKSSQQKDRGPVYVRARGHRPAPGSGSGAHVRHLALELPFPRHVGTASRLRDAEIDDPRDAVASHDDVLRRHVPVHEPQQTPLFVAGLVRGVQTVQDRGDNRDRDSDRDVQSPLARQPEKARERLAVDVLHHEAQTALFRVDVEDADDVRVADAAGEARLVDEHRDEVRIPRQGGVKALDGHGA